MQWNRVLTVAGCHAGGEIGNVITGGFGDVPGETMFDKIVLGARAPRRGAPAATQGAAWQRRAQRQPRAAEQPPAGRDGLPHHGVHRVPGDVGQQHDLRSDVVLLETGMIPMTEPVTHLVLESLAGLIRLRCECSGGKVTSVRFTNQPHVRLPPRRHHRRARARALTVDVAWGGMAYVLVDAASLGFQLRLGRPATCACSGSASSRPPRRSWRPSTPRTPVSPYITQTEFFGPLGRTRRRRPDLEERRRRLPGSAGPLPMRHRHVGAGLAVLHAKGLIAPGERFVHESVLGTTFDSAIESLTTGDYPAVVPSVAGQAWITDLSQVGLDPHRPLPPRLHPHRHLARRLTATPPPTSVRRLRVSVGIAVRAAAPHCGHAVLTRVAGRSGARQAAHRVCGPRA